MQLNYIYHHIILYVNDMCMIQDLSGIETSKYSDLVIYKTYPP